jgi:hypothetical protein
MLAVPYNASETRLLIAREYHWDEPSAEEGFAKRNGTKPQIARIAQICRRFNRFFELRIRAIREIRGIG